MYIKRNNLTIDLTELKRLEEALPYGAKAEIARITGLHRNSVDKVFAGEWNSEDVIDAACALIRRESNSTKKKRILIHETLRDYIQSLPTN
ncbi:MAG: hypothetical protein RLN88_04110 [Ekhidna sp.]|uniref:hypothetical protein n=1 Tax=Ekhidna sp. TaxID=2608089 RepID=UPI0032F0458A